MDGVIKTYAAYSKNDELRLRSSSGAIFSQLAELVLGKDGIVYGVTMSDDCKQAEFLGIKKLNDLSKLQGSKYMQAKVGGVYNKVKDDLDEGKLVLFSGTGCQVNGLKSYLGRDYNNLFCVDVICHGVPSPRLWKKHINYIEDVHNKKFRNVNFRAKDYGWINFGIKLIDESLNSIFFLKDEDSYMYMFLKDYCLRPSCYECMTKKNKKADLTLGDFWGIDSVDREMNDGKGVSIVIIRTSKGKEIFENISKNIMYKEVDYEDGVKYNPAEFRSHKRPEERERFFVDLNTMSYEELKKKYVKINKKPLKRRIKNVIKKIYKYIRKGNRNE